MTLPTIGRPKDAKEPVTNEQVLRVIAFVTVVFPTAVALNVLIWTIAAALWGAR